MPQIPTVVAPDLTPPPQENPSHAGKPGLALAGAAEQFGSVDDFALQVSKQIKKAQDEGIMLGAENSIAADMEKAHSGLANWTDYTNSEQLKQDTANSLREKYVDKYGNRPDLWRYIEPYLGKELNTYNNTVDVKTAQLTEQFNKGALFDSQLHAENEAATEPSIDGKERIWAIQDAKTDMMVKNGTVRADEGEVQKKLLRSRTIQTEVARASNPLNPPEIMQTEMERLKEYAGRNYVAPEELERLQDHLATSYERAVTRAENTDVSKQVDAMLARVQSDPTLKDQTTGHIDYLEAAKRVGEDPDIPLKAKKEAQQVFEQQDAIQKRMRAEYDMKSMDELEPRIGDAQNPLTRSEVRNRALLTPANPKWISHETEAALVRTMNQTDRENRAENTARRMELRQETASDSAGLMQELLSSPGYLTDRSELYQGEYAKLTKGDRATVWAAKNVGNSKEYQEAFRVMKASTIYPPTDEGNIQFARDAEKLRQTVEEKKLTGSQITDEAARMIAPKVEEQKKGFVKSLLDNIFPIARSIVTGKSVDATTLKAPAATAATAPARPKGVPDSAVWNEGARQWQIPSK